MCADTLPHVRRSLAGGLGGAGSARHERVLTTPEQRCCLGRQQRWHQIHRSGSVVFLRFSPGMISRPCRPAWVRGLYPSSKAYKSRSGSAHGKPEVVVCADVASRARPISYSGAGRPGPHLRLRQPAEPHPGNPAYPPPDRCDAGCRMRWSRERRSSAASSR